VCARRKTHADWSWLPATAAEGRTESVRSALRTAILNGTLTAGRYLREADIAEQMAVSRSPVREAIRQLHQEGLVEIYPRHGAIVAGVDEGEVTLMYRLRADIEAQAFERAAQVITHEQLQELTVLWVEMNNGLRARDATRVMDADLAFHGRVVEIGASPLVHRVWTSLDGVVRATVLRYWLSGELDPRATLEVDVHSHLSLLDALQGRDAARARELARRHVTRPEVPQGVSEPATGRPERSERARPVRPTDPGDGK
jgi:DNA-binding GntR family transcriptional regulator